MLCIQGGNWQFPILPPLIPPRFFPPFSFFSKPCPPLPAKNPRWHISDSILLIPCAQPFPLDVPRSHPVPSIFQRLYASAPFFSPALFFFCLCLPLRCAAWLKPRLGLYSPFFQWFFLDSFFILLAWGAPDCGEILINLFPLFPGCTPGPAYSRAFPPTTGISFARSPAGQGPGFKPTPPLIPSLCAEAQDCRGPVKPPFSILPPPNRDRFFFSFHLTLDDYVFR